jgi:hypothetical protein
LSSNSRACNDKRESAKFIDEARGFSELKSRLNLGKGKQRENPLNLQHRTTRALRTIAAFGRLLRKGKGAVAHG